MALGGVVLNLDLHQRATGQVRLHQVQRHDAKAEPCAQKVMLGREIAKTPYSRGQQPESAASPHTRKISVHELNTGGKDPIRPMAQRRSSTGSATASHISTYSLSGIAGNCTWKAATADANTATGNMASTARLSSASSPPARPFARALKRSTSLATARERERSAS